MAEEECSQASLRAQEAIRLDHRRQAKIAAEKIEDETASVKEETVVEVEKETETKEDEVTEKIEVEDNKKE